MALSSQLQTIAAGAAGIYMLEYDESQITTPIADSRMRVHVVNIPKGRVNTLATFQQGDFNGFIREFGDISIKEERKGNFSVRSCLISLENGPIAVLNLRSFDDIQDVTSKLGLSLKSSIDNEGLSTIPYTSLFDTSRFWRIDPSLLVSDVDTNLLNFANIGNTNVSIFVRKSNISGFDARVVDYYTALGRPAPEAIDPTSFVSDYMIDVYIFDNNFENAAINKSNRYYGDLFTNDGVVNTTMIRGQEVDGIEALSRIREAGFVRKITGSLIEGFTDLSNNAMYIETRMNGVLAFTTGVICKVNHAKFDIEADWEPLGTNANNGKKRPYTVDLAGHSFFSTDSGGDIDTPEFNDFLSYKLSYEKQVLDFNYNTGEQPSIYNKAKGYYEMPVLFEQTAGVVNDPSVFTMASLFPIRLNDKLVGETSNLVSIKEILNSGTKIYLTGLHTTYPLQANGTLFPKNSSGQYVYPVGNPNEGVQIGRNTSVPTNDPTYNYPMTAPTGGTVITMPNLTPEQIATLKLEIGNTVHFATVKTSGPLAIGTTTGTLTGNLVTETDTTIGATGLSYKTVQFVNSPEVQSKSYAPFVLGYYKQRKEQFTDGTAARQSRILDVLLTPGIRNSIMNPGLRLRYFIDCFKTYIEPNAKIQLAEIASDKQVLAIANMPSMNDLRLSTNPYFKQTPTGPLDLSYLPEGGNRSLLSTNSFSLPAGGSQNPIETHIAFFGPCFIANYYGQEIIVPPAASVGKAFINKFIAGQPYDLVANTSGVISGNNLTALEYPISDNERTFLEPFGYNSIIQRDNGQFVIFGNQTAQNSIRTSLSKIHVRELVIHIQERMRAILANYIFKLNTPQTRLEVKTKADNEMTTIQDNGGVIWFQNICDDKNNTLEVIQNDMGILETQIIATKSSEKWAHITRLQSGLITGFELNRQ